MRDARYRKPMIVSFSGLDGAGKTTQIENLRALAHSLGLRDTLLAFWDNIVVLSRYREGFVHKVYGSERGIGAPDKPVERRDKNVRAWYLSLIRHGLYLLDALHLAWVIARARRLNLDLVIVDRYIYDELANLPLENPLTRIFVQFVKGLAPTPDIAFLLDADPVAARIRKPEYPVEFMQHSRRAYFMLAELLDNMTVIPPLPLSEAKHQVEQHFLRVLGQSLDATETMDRATA
ncbi:MAG TPA: thymidylate kinase [Terriglobales bacterium]|nr:thymidylate kinase [Terriglobales bacterium]